MTDINRCAPTKAKMKVLKDALDAAISTTKAGVAEAIVPGVGLALLRCIPHLETLVAECEGDKRTGLQILVRALQAPARPIAETSALDGGVVVAKMLEGTGSFGFDASCQAPC